MDELEQRLRSALTAIADEVPPSHHAWADQQRRLALKSRRDRVRPALVAAVAAAVVALIAVPVMVFNLRGSAPVDVGAVPLVTNPPDSSRASAPTSSRETPVGYRALDGETLSTPPLSVGAQFVARDQPLIQTYAYTTRGKTGLQSLCFAQADEGAEINGPQQAKYGGPSCSPLSRPKNGKYFWGSRNVPSTDSANMHAYVMSTPADNLMLRDGNDKLVLAQQKSKGDEVVLFVAYLSSGKPASAFTVRDISNNVMQNGP